MLKKDKIEITEKIQFEVNKAEIKEVSFGLLNEIAEVMKKAPYVKKIRIEGHASSEGVSKLNLELSDKRSKAVMAYLVDKAGIAPDRLIAEGFGDKRPIADNKTKEGREANRRVEFNIIEQDLAPVEVPADQVPQTMEQPKGPPPPDQPKVEPPPAVPPKGVVPKAPKPPKPQPPKGK